jgi:hypothetical protein
MVHPFHDSKIQEPSSFDGGGAGLGRERGHKMRIARASFIRRAWVMMAAVVSAAAAIAVMLASNCNRGRLECQAFIER